MVASPTTTYLYAISLILVYGSIPMAFAVGATTTVFAIIGILCILSIFLIQGLRCAMTGETVYEAPGQRTTSTVQYRADGTSYTTTRSWYSSGGTHNARFFGLWFAGLGLLFGLMIGFGMEMDIQDTFPAAALLLSTITALIGAIAYRS